MKNDLNEVSKDFETQKKEFGTEKRINLRELDLNVKKRLKKLIETYLSQKNDSESQKNNLNKSQ